MRTNVNLFVAAILLAPLGAFAADALPVEAPVSAPKPPPSDAEAASLFSFFITSEGSGKGADLGGLAGADAHCQQLARAVGAGDKTWRAYLSTQARKGEPAVNARDRIGPGPWYNKKGVPIAKDVAQLHGDTVDLARVGNNISWATALTEKGEQVKRAGDTPNQHDILTGSQPDGRAYASNDDYTCNNYTSSAAQGAAQIGHFDRTGGNSISWNSAHATRGCGQENLVATGGAGLFYCFAVAK